MPPLPLVALLALYCSRQVCMRALPALSLANFGFIALGNTALPIGAAGAAAGVAGAPTGAAGAGVPHSAFRKSAHFWLLRVPAVFAAFLLGPPFLIVGAV